MARSERSVALLLTSARPRDAAQRFPTRQCIADRTGEIRSLRESSHQQLAGRACRCAQRSSGVCRRSRSRFGRANRCAPELPHAIDDCVALRMCKNLRRSCAPQTASLIPFSTRGLKAGMVIRVQRADEARRVRARIRSERSLASYSLLTTATGRRRAHGTQILQPRWTPGAPNSVVVWARTQSR
jgi:hypothetical protein